MSYDYNDASRISNEIAAQAEYTRRQNENKKLYNLEIKKLPKEKETSHENN